MFAYERQADETLVLMAGVPEGWTKKEGFAVRNLRTPFGPLSYSLKIEDGQGMLHVEALKQMPVGGIAISWPGEAPPQESFDSARLRALARHGPAHQQAAVHASCSRDESLYSASAAPWVAITFE